LGVSAVVKIYIVVGWEVAVQQKTLQLHAVFENFALLDIL
jgi:hypothetical protein